mgnify:CR=1 FL=1
MNFIKKTTSAVMASTARAIAMSLAKSLKLWAYRLKNCASSTATSQRFFLGCHQIWQMRRHDYGFTPLAGVLMGTRCGDIDPAIVLNVMDNHNLSTKEMDTLMNKKSGVLGISGVSSDFRDLGQAAAEGNERAQLALDMFHYQVRKEIGAFAAAMGGVDVITFTAGVGENGIEDRAAIAEGLEYLGAKLDPQRNDVRGKDALISTDDSTVKMYVIPTNEEIMIARDTKEIVSKQ